MDLQTAIDIAHDIRENFPHVNPHLVETDRKFRDGSAVYILGVYQGPFREARHSWIISHAYDYEDFLRLYRIFANLP